MPIFISYNHSDSDFADTLAKNLVMHTHNVWMDRWELNVGDSLIEKIQSALTASSAILVILSKNSVASEWCKKELNAGLVRELDEKQVLLLPCVIDDCEIPLFLREKFYADFRRNPDVAFNQVHDALLRITNNQQGRIESPDFHTDWSYDWKTDRSKTWYFEWIFVDHGPAIEYSVLTRCQMMCNEVATKNFQKLGEDARQDYIRGAFERVVRVVTKEKFKLIIEDAFEKFRRMDVTGTHGEIWLVEISSRRMGIDNGKATIVHVHQIFERALETMKRHIRTG